MCVCVDMDVLLFHPGIVADGMQASPFYTFNKVMIPQCTQMAVIRWMFYS